MAYNIEDPDKNVDKNSFALFALGFRPFFLFAAFFAPVLIALWLLELNGIISVSGYYSPAGWHAHEMLFGYTVAVIAGFILTAAGNWTEIRMIHGWRLVLLSVTFLLGRFAPFIPELPYWLIALLDFIFIPLVAFILAVPVIKMKQWSNFVFVPILLTMAIANLTVHLSALDIISLSMVTGSRAMVYLVILLIVVMGGRVIPFFTERGVRGVVTKTWNWIEHLSPLSVILVVVFDTIYPNSIITGLLALFAAIVHFIRLAGWYSPKIWRVPLVWILQVGYGWFIIGFIIKALTIFGIDKSLFAFHAFTVGGIGVITLGMMSRVSIGHTGREMILDRWMVLSFILINLAAVVRVLIPMFIPEFYSYSIQLSGWLWVVSFSIYAIIYTPMWLRARIDGREG